MPLVFCGLVLGEQYVPVHLNLLLPLLLAHFELIFPVLQVIDLIDRGLQNLVNLLDFKFHAVMPDKHLLLMPSDPLHVGVSHIVLQNKCLDDFLIPVLLLFDMVLLFLDSSQILFQFFKRQEKQLMVLRGLFELLVQYLDLLL